jgi:hypothetical protein
VRLGAALGLGLALVALAGCGGSRLDTSRAEQQMTEQFRRSLAPAVVGEAHCPDHVSSKKGATFECRLAVGGTDVTVTATQVDGKGSVSVATDKAVIVVAKVQADLTAQLRAAYQSDLDAPVVTVDCGQPPVRVLAVGASFPCTATTPAGTVTQRVVVKDTAGQVAYESPS